MRADLRRTGRRGRWRRGARSAGRYREAMAAKAEITLPVHRVDVETYNRIVASGALEGEHVELLDGVVAEMSPRSPAHDAVIERLTRHFGRTRERVRVQMAIEIAPDSEPEPDLAVIEGAIEADRHPRTALLAVEVSVTSQLIDRNVKAGLYARAGIPTYWLIDVPARAVEAYTEPDGERYRRCTTYVEGESVPCTVEGVAELDVRALMEGVGG